MGIEDQALRDTAIDQYTHELAATTLDKVRKALISKLEKTGVTDISASSLADVILLGGGIVDIIAEAIADAAHYTPSS